MGEQAWWVVFTLLPILGTMVGAVAYRLRERARWTAVTAVLKHEREGTRVRFTADDGQGRATTQWEITLGRSAESSDESAG